MNDMLDLLELELRRIPGIAGVGFSDDDSLVVSVAAEVAAADRARLRQAVAERVRGLVDAPVAIEIQHVAVMSGAMVEGIGGPLGSDRPPRVRLLEVEVERNTEDVVVRLTHLGRHAVGRGGAGSPVDAAEATVRALHALGAEVPFTVKAMASPVGGGDALAVVVLLENDQQPAKRYGVAQADTVEEAACRATLHALNRWLADTRVFATAV